ncbi:MAG: GPW/gp25 family protein [Pseudomonadales bacterium]|nr:GPW/gp25 family protein [Pseudomonadales bacterium]
MDNSFLGRGWAFPPSFSLGGADVEMVSGVEDIHQSLQILLSTQLGERIMQENYGCDLVSMMFQEIDQRLINKLSSLFEDAILNYEPRIKLNKVEVSESDTEQGLLLISLDYLVRATNSRFNMVYPFYLKEAVSPASAG